MAEEVKRPRFVPSTNPIRHSFAHPERPRNDRQASYSQMPNTLVSIPVRREPVHPLMTA
jgi:hypothetical protein